MHHAIDVEDNLAQPCEDCWQRLVQLARLQGNGDVMGYCSHRGGGTLMAAVAEAGVVRGSSFSAPVDRASAAQALHRHCQVTDAVAERAAGVSMQ